MAKIKAEFGAMISAADRLRNSAKNVSSMYDEVTRILKNMPLSTNYYRGVQGKMLLQSESIQQTGKKLETAAGAVEQIVSMYKAANLAAANGTAVAYAKANANILGGMAGLFDDKSWLEKVTGVISNKLSNPHLEHLALLGGLGMAGAPGLTVYGLYRLIEANRTYEKTTDSLHLFRRKLDLGIDDKLQDKGLLKKMSSGDLSKDFDIISAERKKTFSVFHHDDGFENGYLSGKYNVNLLTAEGKLGGGVGKFSYTDANGNKVGAVGLYGEIGASVAAAKFDGELRHGTDLFGTYRKGSVKLLSAETKAESIFALSDRGPQFALGAGAEANLAEASYSKGLRFLGTDFGLTITGKVGAGAKAYAGFKDGKFTCDASAALGLGVGVSFDVDMSGTIDFVKENADNFKSWANDTSKAIGDAWDTTTTVVSDFVDDVGDSIDRGFKKAGKTIEKAGDVIGDAFHGLGDLIGG